MSTATPYQAALLKRLYYDERMLFGRDKLFKIAQAFPRAPSQRVVMEWLREQEVHQLHLNPKTSTAIRSILLKEPSRVYQADLIDMGDSKDRQWRYILTMIDAFSRKAYATPLTEKTSEKTAAGLKKLYDQTPRRKMRLMQTDNGGEFKQEFHQFLMDKNVRHITGIAGRPQSQGIVERFNGTIKTLIYQNMLVTRSKRWSDELDLLLKAYNATVHRTTEEAPIDVDAENEDVVAQRIETRAGKSGLKDQDNLEVGDRVRLRIFKGPLEKASTINWSDEFYTVVRVKRSRKPYVRISYRIEDEDGRELKNSYNGVDLQKTGRVVPPPEAHRRRFLRRRFVPAEDEPADRVLRPRAPRQAQAAQTSAAGPSNASGAGPSAPRTTPASRTDAENRRLYENTVGAGVMRPGQKFKSLSSYYL